MTDNRQKPASWCARGATCLANVARVAFKRSAYLRNFVLQFAELLSDRLDRKPDCPAMEGHDSKTMCSQKNKQPIELKAKPFFYHKYGHTRSNSQQRGAVQ
jgi:hypothetical protein